MSFYPPFSKALQFDGVNDKVEIADNAAFSPITTGAFSVQCWVMFDVDQQTLTADSGYIDFFSKGTYDVANQLEWCFRIYNRQNTETDNRQNEISFYVFNLAGGLGVSGDVKKLPTNVGKWLHLVGTVDDTNKYVSLYCNGVLCERASYSGTVTLEDGTSVIRMGTNEDTSAFLKGKLADCRIWNRVLSDTEINDLYHDGRNISLGLVGWWKLNEGTGASVADSSSTGVNGTITGATWIDTDTANYSRRRVSSFIDPLADDYNPRRLNRRTINKSLICNGSDTVVTFSGFTPSSDNFTASMWIKYKSMTINDRFLDYQDGGPSGGFTFNSSTTTFKKMNFAIRNGGSSVASLTTPQIELSIWYHIVGVYSDDNVYIYLNGRNVAEDLSANMSAPTQTLTLARRSATATNYFNGLLADFIFWNRALSRSEVEDVYYGGSIPTGPVIHLDFNGNLTDTSGNGNSGTGGGTIDYSDDVPPVSA